MNKLNFNITDEAKALTAQINSLNKLVKLAKEDTNLTDYIKITEAKDQRKSCFDKLTSLFVTPENAETLYTVTLKNGQEFTGKIIGNVKVYGKSIHVHLFNETTGEKNVAEINKNK